MNNKDDNLDKILNTYLDSDPRVLQIVGDIEKSIADSKTSFEDVEEYLQSQNWCNVCRMQFENRKTFQQHLTNHSDSLTCPDCEKRFSRKDALKRHQKNACVSSSKHRKILCDRCGTVKKGTFCSCTVHDEEKYQCEFCSFRVNSMRELFQYFLDKHKVVQTSVSDRLFLSTNNSNDLQSNLNHAKTSESLLQTGGETQSGINKSVPEESNSPLTQTGGKQSTRNRKQKTFRVK